MPFAYLFTLVGAAIGLVRGLPQLVRLLRRRNPHSVSVDSAATTSIVSLAWATYGAWTDQLRSSWPAPPPAGIRPRRRRCLTLRPHHPRTSRSPLWLLFLLANGPQVRVAWHERDLSGLSLGTWLLSVAEAVAWGSYGFFAHGHASSPAEPCTRSPAAQWSFSAC